MLHGNDVSFPWNFTEEEEVLGMISLSQAHTFITCKSSLFSSNVDMMHVYVYTPAHLPTMEIIGLGSSFE